LFHYKHYYVYNETDTCYHARYYEKNHQSKAYNEVIDFCKRTDFVNVNYQTLKETYPQQITKHNLYDLQNVWIPLDCYKGKYYLADNYYYFKIVADTFLVENDMEGLNYSVYESIKQVSPKEYRCNSVYWKIC